MAGMRRSSSPMRPPWRAISSVWAIPVLAALAALFVPRGNETAAKKIHAVFHGANLVLAVGLLLIFINNRGAVLSRQQILHNIWDVAGDFVTDNTLTVYVKRLREKLEDGDEVIQTVRGLGYRMV